MTKNLLIKVISGKATSSEERSVLAWINRDKRNLKYYVELKELWISQNLPEERAGLEYLSECRFRTIPTQLIPEKRAWDALK